MVGSVSSSLIFYAFFSLIFAIEVRAAVTDAELDNYFEFLTRINHYSPLEHAGSHGTLGVGLGAGVASYVAPESRALIKDHWRQPGVAASANEASSARMTTAQIHVHKGLPLSLDVGGGIARDTRTDAKFISGYLQWTAYEAFARPALAMRGQYSRLMTLATTDASALEVTALASYGFLRLFTVYGAYGLGRHDMRIRFGDHVGTNFSLNGEPEGSIGRVLIRKTRSVGMQYQLLPPFCHIAAEYNQVGTGPGSYLAKFSVGI